MNNLELVKKNWHNLRQVKNITHEIVMAAISQHSEAITIIPKEFINQEVCNKAIEMNPDTIKLIPKEFQTEDLIIQAFEYDPKNFKHVLNQTEELAYEAIKLSSDLLHYVEAQYQSERIITHCLIESPMTLAAVANKTKQWCDLAIESCINYNDEMVNIFEEVPEQFRTEKLCLMVLSKNSLCLKEIKNQTIEMCLNVINEDKTYFEMVKIVPNETHESTLRLLKEKQAMLNLLSS